MNEEDFKPFLMAQIETKIGDVFLDGVSPKYDNYHLVFEDDGQTGYLYAYDTSNAEQPILDALHIYNVHDVLDKDKPSLFQIVWSYDGLKGALLINNYSHAVFDLEKRRGYCRTNFPPPNPEFTAHSHEWDEDCISWL